MKHLKHLIILVILTLFVTVNSYASDEVVFKDVKYLTTELQQCEILKKENKVLNNQVDLYTFDINILENTISNINSQNSVLLMENEIQRQYLEVTNNTIISYDNLLKEQKEMYELIMKESKPSFWSKVKNTVGLIGIGILIGVGVVLL